jgi:hypothetical protein
MAKPFRLFVWCPKGFEDAREICLAVERALRSLQVSGAVEILCLPGTAPARALLPYARATGIRRRVLYLKRDHAHHTRPSIAEVMTIDRTVKGCDAAIVLWALEQPAHVIHTLQASLHRVLVAQYTHPKSLLAYPTALSGFHSTVDPSFTAPWGVDLSLHQGRAGQSLAVPVLMEDGRPMPRSRLTLSMSMLRDGLAATSDARTLIHPTLKAILSPLDPLSDHPVAQPSDLRGFDYPAGTARRFIRRMRNHAGDRACG